MAGKVRSLQSHLSSGAVVSVSKLSGGRVITELSFHHERNSSRSRRAYGGLGAVICTGLRSGWSGFHIEVLPVPL